MKLLISIKAYEKIGKRMKPLPIVINKRDWIIINGTGDVAKIRSKPQYLKRDGLNKYFLIHIQNWTKFKCEISKHHTHITEAFTAYGMIGIWRQK